jgi:hypothetical protein
MDVFGYAKCKVCGEPLRLNEARFDEDDAPNYPHDRASTWAHDGNNQALSGAARLQSGAGVFDSHADLRNKMVSDYEDWTNRVNLRGSLNATADEDHTPRPHDDRTEEQEVDRLGRDNVSVQTERAWEKSNRRLREKRHVPPLSLKLWVNTGKP